MGLYIYRILTTRERAPCSGDAAGVQRHVIRCLEPDSFAPKHPGLYSSTADPALFRGSLTGGPTIAAGDSGECTSMEKEIDLQEHFPEMLPLTGAPTLHRINGCGTGMYGRRDEDLPTDSYIKTLCFSLLFIPVLALRAYRVSDVPGGGWYFLGRVPLSGLGRFWNLLVLGAVTITGGFFWWQNHITSPHYLGKQKVAHAESLRDQGKLKESAQLYLEVATKKTTSVWKARETLRELVGGDLGSIPLTDAASVVEAGIRLEEVTGKLSKKKSELFGKGMDLVWARGEQDPLGGLAVLNAIEKIADRPEELDEVREKLFEKALARDPGNAEFLSGLAVLLENRGEVERAGSLLEPHAEKLGTLEGARILGQTYMRQQKIEEAFRLLSPYVEARLGQLHEAKGRFQRAYEVAWSDGVSLLESGTARGFDFRAYKYLAPQDQQTRVQKYLQDHVNRDARVKDAQEAMVRLSPVVTVTLDLATVRLERAQELTDPETRRLELERAEQLFVAVQGVAEENDQYRLYYGQVCYWLGKHDEGKKLFDELLASHKRTHEVLIATARVLRQVGVMSEARALAEEAYERAGEEQDRYAAASLLALCQTDNDEEIEWLRRSDPSDPHTQASLSLSLGSRALDRGNKGVATVHLRKALQDYSRMARTSGSLNNASLASLYLYRATGSRTDLDRALTLMEESLELQPGNAILLYNLAHVRSESAVLHAVDGAVDLNAVNRSANLEVLSFLFRNQSERERYVERLRRHRDFERALQGFEKALVLAPKNADVFRVIKSIAAFTDDVERLRGLRRRLDSVTPDLSAFISQRHDLYAGRKDAEYQERFDSLLKKQGESVRALSPSTRPIDYAVATATLVSSSLDAYITGNEADANQLVGWAEKAHEAHPSSGTRAVLYSALCFRAARRLEDELPVFAPLATNTRRALRATRLLAAVTRLDPRLRERILRDPDARRAARLLKETDRDFPDLLDGWQWALLEAFHPDERSALRRRFLGSERQRLLREIELVISPQDSSAVLEVYFALSAAGKEQDARSLLEKHAREGTPLPLGEN